MDLFRQNWIDSLRPKIPSSHPWKFAKFQRDLVVFYAQIILFSPWIVDIRVIIQNGYHKPDGGKYKNNARIIGKTPNDKTRKQFRSRPKFNENSWWYTLYLKNRPESKVATLVFQRSGWKVTSKCYGLNTHARTEMSQFLMNGGQSRLLHLLWCFADDFNFRKFVRDWLVYLTSSNKQSLYFKML